MNRNTKILLGVLGLGALAYFIFKPKSTLAQKTKPSTPPFTPPFTPPILPSKYPSGYKEGDYVKASRNGIIFLLKDGKAYPIQNFNPTIHGQSKDIPYELIYSLPIGEMIAYDNYGKIITTYPDGYKDGDYVLFKLKIANSEVPFIYLLKGGKAYQFKNIKDFDEKKYGLPKPISMADISKIPKADTYA